MKKLLPVLLLGVLVLSLTGCGRISGNVLITNEASDIYQVEEIEAAMDVAQRYFRLNFKGCTMTEIGYIGDEKWAAMEDYATEYGVDQAIVLTSTFETDRRGGDGSLNANETYRNWKWILIRDLGGEWSHADHGYG
ncbi:MAG: hypothetical protein E7469_07235 [Ruminococcaceae bacterium]|nr:hypothetical protein [Oscillospiraceae bacterium]